MHRIEILLLRHGISIWNQKNIHQGQNKLDPGLADEGRKQVQRAAEFLCNEQILSFWSSPLTRARQTAIIIYKAYQRDHTQEYIPLIHDYGLMEITNGVADGMHFEKIKEQFPVEYEKMMGRVWHEALFPGGEVPIEAMHRSYKTHRNIAKIAAIFKKNSQNLAGKIIIIAHGALNCFFLCQITETPLDKGWEKFSQDNCCINRIIWDNSKEKFEILSVNETSYLGDLHYTDYVAA